MKKLILLILFLLFFYNLNSQELFIFGEDNFKSSKTISYGNLDVLFLSKPNNKAFVALTMDIHWLACDQASISHNPFFAAPLSCGVPPSCAALPGRAAPPLAASSSNQA